MSFNPLAGDYAPQDPYRQYHGQPEAEQKRQQYLGQQNLSAGAIAGNNRVVGGDIRAAHQQGGVTREMQYLEKNLHALANAIDLLDGRLAAACIAAPETAPGLRGMEPSGCTLANQLAAFNGMLSHQITRLEMLYQGIDL